MKYIDSFKRDMQELIIQLEEFLIDEKYIIGTRLGHHKLMPVYTTIPTHFLGYTLK